jgi:hypothetical protein
VKILPSPTPWATGSLHRWTDFRGSGHTSTALGASSLPACRGARDNGITVTRGNALASARRRANSGGGAAQDRRLLRLADTGDSPGCVDASSLGPQSTLTSERQAGADNHDVALGIARIRLAMDGPGQAARAEGPGQRAARHRACQAPDSIAARWTRHRSRSHSRPWWCQPHARLGPRQPRPEPFHRDRLLRHTCFARGTAHT